MVTPLGEIVDEMQRSSTIDLRSFSERFDRRLEEMTRPSQASLASYMMLRRSIIEMYKQLLRKAGDRYQREAAIHRLIFPMGRDHETSKAFLEHNLWLIDERLTFADYIASDMRLQRHKALFGVNDKDEPDVVAYYNLGFSTDDPAEGTLRNVVIVEFKRPGPLQKKDEDPWRQVMRYIRKMRDGFENEDGQKIKAGTNTRFYCYILCDSDDPNVQQFLEEHQFKPIFDGEEGYFLYHEALKTYAELLPFSKVLRDVERNHRAFFERLGLLLEK
jgi:hypothetical protein